MATQKCHKNAKEYYCEKCDFRCSKESNYKIHLSTRKHQLATKSTEKIPKHAAYFCDCGKKYKDRTGLWRHKKKCSLLIETSIVCQNENPSSDINTDLLVSIIKSNQELQKQMLDVIPNLQPNINSNNNNFNINVFLNEECKDAINMSDFIKSIEVTMEDLEKIGMDGQTEGMSNLLINRLKSMDVLRRPLHCSDAKKEIIYIKDADKWEEEKKDRPKLKNALEEITKKSVLSLPYMTDTDKQIKTYDEVLKDPREDKKIISKVAKEICIN
jgi:hypothetical protein